MIESLTIRNFQRHERKTITFDQLTTIRADNDQGKSALLRALRWIMFNQPQGSGFIRWGSTFSKVRLKVDGKEVVRSKGKGNAYFLDGEKYVSFGSNVPEPIATLLNVCPDNYQGQHAPPFWFSKTPGEVSKELNAIINLGSIDRALSNAAAKVRQVKSSMEESEDRLKEREERLNSLAWVDEAEQDWKQIEQLIAQSEETAQKLSRIASLLDTGRKAESIRGSVSGASQVALKAYSLARKAVETGERLSRLRKLLNNFSSLDKESCETRAKARVAREELERRTGGVCPLCKGPLSSMKARK